MKYPKFLQVLARAAVVTTSIPLTDASVHASDSKETPKEYEARTEYSLPEGYHYVLSDGKYVVFAEDGKVKIEKDEAKKAEVKKAEPKKAEVKKAELEKTNNVDAAAYIGTVIAKRALEKGITTVVFDRGGYIYQGKVQALADAAREAGLTF